MDKPGQSDIAAARTTAASSLPPLTLSLDDLIAQVIPSIQAADAKRAEIKAFQERTAAEKEEIMEARRKLAARDICGLTGKQRLELRERILKWEVEHEWEPISFVANEQVDICSCGSSTSHIIGVYQHQRRRAKHADQRLVVWAPEQATDPRVPRSVVRIERFVDVCSSCLFDHGFVGAASLPETIEEVIAPTIKKVGVDEIERLRQELSAARLDNKLLSGNIQIQQAEIRMLQRTLNKFRFALNAAKRFIRKGERKRQLWTKKELTDLLEAREEANGEEVLVGNKVLMKGGAV
jgi:hypothetical protein